jgi:hypothetical protein
VIKKFLAAVLFTLLPININATDFSVLYDCSVPPSQATPVWNIIGRCNYQLNLASGVLHMVNPDQCSWVLLERADSRITQALSISIEARVKVPTGSGHAASPQIAFTGLDYGLPYDNRAHIWYAVDLYPTGIGFTKVDDDQAGGNKLFGYFSIPDLNSTFHTITLQMHQVAGARDFVVYVDAVPAIAVSNEIDSRPITAVDVGYGLMVAVGDSYWDYVKYWSESPIGVETATWGSIKSLYR